MFEAIQFKALEFVYSLRNRLRDERGQTATEYTLMVAVGAALAIGVVWFLLNGVLSNAISAIGSEITAFISAIFT